MVDLYDFLPSKYKSRDLALSHEEKRGPLGKNNNLVADSESRSVESPTRVSQNKSMGIFLAIALLLAGTGSSIFLIQQNQDVRQRASSGSIQCETDPNSPYFDVNCKPSVDLTLSPSITPNKNRPKTEADCRDQGFWINNSCYLFWETLPGGTHVVVPPEFSGRAYATLVPIDKVSFLQDPVQSVTPASEPTTTSLTPTPSVAYDFTINGACSSPFYIVGGKCVPNQRDPAWDSRWINATGCGAMQALYYALKKNPSLDIDAFLDAHYAKYLAANQSTNTTTESNLKIIEDLGYSIEPYSGTVAYHGEKLTAGGNTIFIRAEFNNSISHFTSIDKVVHNNDGTTTLNMVDSYFGADKCVSVKGQAQAYNCYNDQGEKVASLNLATASVYVVSDNEI